MGWTPLAGSLSQPTWACVMVSGSFPKLIYHCSPPWYLCSSQTDLPVLPLNHPEHAPTPRPVPAVPLLGSLPLWSRLLPCISQGSPQRPAPQSPRAALAKEAPSPFPVPFPRHTC